MYNSEKYGWYVLNTYDAMKVFAKKKIYTCRRKFCCQYNVLSLKLL